MADLTAIPSDSNTDPDRLRRLMALSGGMSVAPQPGVPPQPLPSPAKPWMAGSGAEPRVPGRALENAEAPSVDRLTPIGGSSLPPSDATRLQPIGFKAREALPMTSPGVAAGSAADYQNRLQKIEDEKAHPWGSEENHPGFGGKLAHIAAKVGNIAGDIVAPATMALIPGTDLNRQREEGRVTRRLGEAETRETAEASEKTREKHEENLSDVNQQKLADAERKLTETEWKDKSAREVALRKQGLKEDENGKAIPLAPEDMSENERAVHDLKVAQADAAQARTLVDQMRANPNSPQNQAIRDRIKVMAQNAATAAGKLGLDKKKFVADYFGVDDNGDPIPGTTTDEKTGKPIGPRVAHAAVANAPGAERLKRADLAQNVIQNSDDMRRMIRDNPNLFGKVAGRVTSVQQMVGSDDPEISRLGVAMHNIALASNGAHGLRSAEAVKETEDRILNHFRNGPEATLAAVDEIDKSVQSFIEAAKHGKQPMPSPGETPKTPAAAAPASGGGFADWKKKQTP